MALTTRLSPPQIESKLPAFNHQPIETKDGTMQYVMTIPFNLNRAVGRSEVSGMSVIIRTVQTNVQKAILKTKSVNNISELYGTKGFTVDFLFNDSEFTPLLGQYYKVQLACIDNDGIIGYYSTVGVIKCTSSPTVIFNEENLQRNTYEYTVTCSQDKEIGDITEKIYSYTFNLYNENNQLVATSGEQIHNNSKDTNSYEQVDTWILRKVLDPNIKYELGYSATTINGLRVAEIRKSIVDGSTVPPNIHADIIATPNNDDGYVQISLKGHGEKIKVSGSFILIRSSSEDNFDSWYPMTKFQLIQWDTTTTLHICRDYSVQQGLEYQYAIQSYNSAGLYSDKHMTSRVTCDFEDAFLYDGERQLKIRFNPKVSSFKSTVLESKTNTIGGKYPFIFRNGNVEYKEFQISGLITLLADENNEFQTGLPRDLLEQRNSTAAIGPVHDMGTWLTGENYKRERQFKLEVLKWLNNGKPKLFRSPAEGNYIVRLMNISLTPNDTLGRMLHTFNCSACEIAEPTFENFYDYGFVIEDYTETRNIKINQINLNNIPSNMQNGKNTILLPSAYMAAITADPGVSFSYTLANYSVERSTQIGVTGAYYFSEHVLKETPLTSITLLDNKWGTSAYLTYGYYDDEVNSISYIHDIKTADEIVQMPGQGITYNEDDEIVGINIIEQLEDVRTKTGAFHYIRVATKPLQDIVWNSSKSVYQYDATADVIEWNVGTLYRVLGENNTIFFSGDNPPPNKKPFTSSGAVNAELASYVLYADDHLYEFKIDNNPMVDFSGNKETDGRYNALTNLSSVNNLYAGKGLILDLIYQKKEITYTVEIESEYVTGLKEKWIEAKTAYMKVPTDANKKAMDEAYNSYIWNLEILLKQEGEEYDIQYAI